MGFLRSYAFAQRLCPPLRKERRTFLCRSALHEMLRLVPRRATPTSAMRCVAALRSDTPLPALSSAPSCLEPCRAFPPAPSAGARLFFTARLSSRWASTMPSASSPAVPSTASPSRSRPAAPSRAAFRLFFARTALYRAFLPGIWKKVRFRAILFSGAIGFMRKRKRFPS